MQYSITMIILNTVSELGQVRHHSVKTFKDKFDKSDIKYTVKTYRTVTY